MLTDTAAVRTYFAKLGLGQEIADLYLSLYAHGPQTISKLSRTSGVERTRIYRLIDTLLDSNLIELDAQQKRGVIKAAPISNLRILINQRQQELKNLTDELELMEQVLSRNSLSYADTRVQFFPGPEGLRQMLHHELSAKSITGYQHNGLEAAVTPRFLAEYHQKLKDQQIVAHLSPTTNDHSCHIYGTVIAYFFTGSDTYGFELHNAQIANKERKTI